jgi:hypothetical protein
MGGNITVTYQGKEYTPTPFVVTAYNRDSIINSVARFVEALTISLCIPFSYTGSYTHLRNHFIPTDELLAVKDTFGDVDVCVEATTEAQLLPKLVPGAVWGGGLILGTKRHGNEISVIVKLDPDSIKQIDFQFGYYPFLHSSDWFDLKLGIKGVFHKILLNCIGLDKYKFSISHGLRERSDNSSDMGITDVDAIFEKLFGFRCSNEHMHSFIHLVDLINKFKTNDEALTIYNKFVTDVTRAKGIDPTAAINYLNENLEGEFEVAVVPLMGCYPISHVGQAKDLGSVLKDINVPNFVGLSANNNVFSSETRLNIIKQQWNVEANFVEVNSVGETLLKAYQSLPPFGHKVLHIVVGADREDWAYQLMESIEKDKIIELEGCKFGEIFVQTAEERQHNLSGTAMRLAASNGDIKTFTQHIGDSFSLEDVANYMETIKTAINENKLKLHR